MTVLPEDFFAPAAVTVREGGDGVLYLSSPRALGDYPPALGHYLVHWAATAPNRAFLAERDGDGDWRTLSYADALDRVRRLASRLLTLGLGPGRPIAILSPNSIAQALLSLAAIHVGIPVAPVSPAYALMSRDYGKLKHVMGLLAPGMIFVDTPAPFAAALGALDTGPTRLLARQADHAGGDNLLLIDDLIAAGDAADTAVDKAFAALTPDTVAKILFTSGSTGDPKGVINSQRMLCSNQQAMAQCWPFLERHPPVLLDWLPWSHTFGANHNFNLVLRNGGTLYIDQGKPAPGLIEATVSNLKNVAPTLYFNVPAGYEALLPYLEADAAFARHFFSNLEMVFYAAAALPQAVWERLEAVASKAGVARPVFASAWGSTETAPLATTVHYPIARAGTIGLPIPGTVLKLVPTADSFEVRVKGPNITPGYWRQPELNHAAFDDEGYYIIGDAVRFAEPGNPAAGLAFDGRIGENFKLRSGTWVNVGNLRIQAISAGQPLIRDAVVAGDGETFVSLLIFPDEAGCRQAAGKDLPLAELIADPDVIAALRRGLAAYNRQFPASSTRIRRALFMLEPPDIDKGETTDKGYINQRAVLRRRADLVARLYADGDGVIVID